MGWWTWIRSAHQQWRSQHGQANYFTSIGDSPQPSPVSCFDLALHTQTDEMCFFFIESNSHPPSTPSWPTTFLTTGPTLSASLSDFWRQLMFVWCMSVYWLCVRWFEYISKLLLLGTERERERARARLLICACVSIDGEQVPNVNLSDSWSSWPSPPSKTSVLDSFPQTAWKQPRC